MSCYHIVRVDHFLCILYVLRIRFKVVLVFHAQHFRFDALLIWLKIFSSPCCEVLFMQELILASEKYRGLK